jgi:hypothetical protein
MGSSRKGKISKMTQEVGSQNAKDICKRGQSTNPGVLRSKIRCGTNGRCTECEYGNSATDIAVNL